MAPRCDGRLERDRDRGATAIMVAGESMARGAKGHYATSLVDVFGEGHRARGDRLSETVKLTVLAGQWMAEAHRGRYYAKAQNLSPQRHRGL